MYNDTETNSSVWQAMLACFVKALKKLQNQSWLIQVLRMSCQLLMLCISQYWRCELHKLTLFIKRWGSLLSDYISKTIKHNFSGTFGITGYNDHQIWYGWETNEFHITKTNTQLLLIYSEVVSWKRQTIYMKAKTKKYQSYHNSENRSNNFL